MRSKGGASIALAWCLPAITHGFHPVSGRWRLERIETGCLVLALFDMGGCLLATEARGPKGAFNDACRPN
jgi:hypothetical protein